MKQKTYIAGLYYRLSQEDERQGESVSIDNQRTMLRKYAEEHGFEIHDEYIDDGVSGTTFQRPEVQRLLDDAKTGVINTIIVKDLSRVGVSILRRLRRENEDEFHQPERQSRFQFQLRQSCAAGKIVLLFTFHTGEGY